MAAWLANVWRRMWSFPVMGMSAFFLIFSIQLRMYFGVSSSPPFRGRGSAPLWNDDPTCRYGAAVAGRSATSSSSTRSPRSSMTSGGPMGVDPIRDACPGRIRGWITDECWTNHVEPLMDRYKE